ncbi:MAG: phosphate/phosphite/phosphonate ABC transporter substrate-binding protein [Cyanobacteria bacterium REEB65]|nr:phosphate/phosphite/phosphonate ABC transporter substrate-binding protein [Cyanobacteria bacterium REEB65]
MRRFFLAGIAACLLVLPAWDAEAYQPPILRIGFVPSETAQAMNRHVVPLIARLRAQLGMSVAPFIPTDYPGVIEAMRSEKIDAAFLSPGAYVLAERDAARRHRPFWIKPLLKSIRHGSDVYYAAIIVRADSKIHALKDLKGKRFAFGDPQSMAGSIFPKALLQKAGIHPDRDLVLLPPGGHDSTVLAVFDRRADAGAVFANDRKGKSGAWTVFLKKPSQRRQIIPIALSRPIPNDLFCVRADLDSALVSRLEHALLALQTSHSGSRLLHEIYDIDGFEPAHNADYNPVRDALPR